MKILFINPPRKNGLPVIREDRCEIVNRYLFNPPYSLLHLAACVREKGNTAGIIDANIENLSYQDIRRRLIDFDPSLVIFRFTAETIEDDIITADVAKAVSDKIITVGLCLTLRDFSDQILREFSNLDIYVRGEYGTYEISVNGIIDAITRKDDLKNVPGLTYRKGNIITSTGNDFGDISLDYPFPAYDLIPPLSNYYINPRHKEHSPFTLMYTSMGCPFQCTYCVVQKTKWRARTVENVISEIARLKNEHGLNCIQFKDETFTMDRERTIDICNELIRRKIKIRWYASTRVDKVDNELLKIMREAGCRSLSFGVESGSQKVLDTVQKGIMVEQALDAIKMTKEAGIWVHLGFVVGLPGETKETFKETIAFVKKALPAMAQFNTAIPYPGTKLFDDAVQKGILDKNINYKQLRYDKSILRTETLSCSDIDRLRKKAYLSLYFNPKWILSQFRNFEEVGFTLRYYSKCIYMFLVQKMKHSH